jgi:hypothetical protein
MTAINKKTFLTGLHDRITIIRNNLAPFLQLTNEQLNWKPAPDKWSIAAVFEHLNITHGIYIRYINQSLSSAPVNGRVFFKPGWLGELAYKIIMPREDGSVFKLKAPVFLQAGPGMPEGKLVLQHFMRQLDELEHILELSAYVDLQKIKIPFSFTHLLKLRLGDNLRFIVAHNERHLLQAQKILVLLPNG